MDNEQCRGQLVNPELQRCLSPGRHHQRVKVVRGNSQHPRRLGGRYTPKERWTLQETTEKYRGAVTLYRTGPSFGSITLASTVLGGRPSRHAKAVRKVIQSEEHTDLLSWQTLLNTSCSLSTQAIGKCPSGRQILLLNLQAGVIYTQASFLSNDPMEGQPLSWDEQDLWNGDHSPLSPLFMTDFSRF